MVEHGAGSNADVVGAPDPADDVLPELSCPGCDCDLTWDDLFLSHRICGSCRRHFYLSPGERLALIAPGESFIPADDDVTAITMFGADASAANAPSPAQRFANTRERDSINDAVVTGIGRVGSEEAMLVILDEHATGTTIGALATEKILLAMELAAIRQFPLIMFIAGGSAAVASGPLSLVQPTRLAGAMAKLHLAGIPTFAVVCQSASNDLVGSLAGQCDVVIAEPGTRLWHRRLHSGAHDEPPVSVDAMLEGGLLDDVIDRERQLPYLAAALDVLCRHRGERSHQRFQGAPPASGDSGRDETPLAASVADSLVESQILIRGDRASADATSIRAGFGRVGGQTVAFVTFDRSEFNLTSDLHAVQKLIRSIGLANRLDIPLVILIGDDHAVSSTTADALAISKLTGVLTVAPVAVVVAVVGDVHSPLARALLCGDRVLSHSQGGFAIDGTPPGPGRMPGSGWSRVTAGEALHLGIIEEVIDTGPDVGRLKSSELAALLEVPVVTALMSLGATGSRRRVADRQRKIRSFGQSTPAGRAALRAELTEFGDLQRNIVKSVEDWRDKWETLRSGQPRLNLQRPDFTEIATRLRVRRTELLERARSNDRTRH